MTPSRSYEKVPYPIRPSKQVERKLFLEILHKLGKEGLPVQDYTYIGMGSIFYVDFILFHRYLYVESMICAEHSDDKKRMRFNKPYKFIRLENGDVASLIPEVEEGKRYLVWLDYDTPLDGDKLNHFGGFLRRLASGSVIMITVDAQRRIDEDELQSGTTLKDLDDQACKELNLPFKRYLGRPVVRADLSYNGLPSMLSRVLRAKSEEIMALRGSMRLLQLFNYRYADGAQMYTYGGLVCDQALGDRLASSTILEVVGVARGLEPISISVPPLTMREKEWLDSKIRSRIRIDKMPFELKQSALDAYLEFYKHYPSFRDALL